MDNDTNSAANDETLNAGATSGETPTTPPGTGETPGTTDTAKELADLKAALKKANQEAASHRHKASELDQLKAKLEADKLSETERLQKQLADLQTQYETANRTTQERTINYEVRLQAAQMGIVDPDAAAKLLDWSKIDHDEEGSPTNIADLLKELVKNKPYLAGRAQQTSGGPTNPSRSQSTAPATLSWDVIGKMTPQEYAARSTEIRAWIAAHPFQYGRRLP